MWLPGTSMNTHMSTDTRGTQSIGTAFACPLDQRGRCTGAVEKTGVCMCVRACVRACGGGGVCALLCFAVELGAQQKVYGSMDEWICGCMDAGQTGAR